MPHLLPISFIRCCCWNIWKSEMSWCSLYILSFTCLLRTATFCYVFSISGSHLRNPLIQCNLMYSLYLNFSDCLSMIFYRCLPKGSIKIHSFHWLVHFFIFLWSITVSSPFVIHDTDIFDKFRPVILKK